MDNLNYAGFWIRFVAALIDGILANILGYIAGFTIAIIAVVTFPEMGEAATTGLGFLGGLAGVAIFWVYHAYFESGPHQATPGKRLVDIKVCDENGQRLTFARASGRTFAKWISTLLMLIGYLMAGWTQKKQALHDFIASTVVVNVDPISSSISNAAPPPPSEAQSAPPPPAPASGADSQAHDQASVDNSEAVTRALDALRTLHEKGAITEDEYTAKKQDILRRL